MFTLISAKISAIPTTLITGFLGAGKTTAILHLLANKPQNENWAVLVNEFGEIGIDSVLLETNVNKNNEKEFLFAKYLAAVCVALQAYLCR